MKAMAINMNNLHIADKAVAVAVLPHVKSQVNLYHFHGSFAGEFVVDLRLMDNLC